MYQTEQCNLTKTYDFVCFTFDFRRLTCLDCSKSKVVQVFVGKGPNGSDSYGPASFISYKVATPTLYGQVPLAPKLPSEWDIAPQHQPQLQ
jgi:hypothetical protein